MEKTGGKRGARRIKKLVNKLKHMRSLGGKKFSVCKRAFRAGQKGANSE